MAYELKQTKSGKFFFNLKAANHKVILTSETYESRAAALNGIKSVQKNGTNKANFESKTSKSNQPYFVLKAKNQQVIGQSQMYKTPEAAEKGVASVIANASSESIIEVKSVE